MKKSVLLVVLLFPILLFPQKIRFPQKISKETQYFKDTVDASELFTKNGKSLFSKQITYPSGYTSAGGMMLSEKTLCNGRMCVYYRINDFDTLVFKAIYNGELFTGIAENFKYDTLIGRYAFIEGELIQAFITSTDGSHFSIQNFKNMLRHGDYLVFWSGKLAIKIYHEHGAEIRRDYVEKRVKETYDYGG